MMDWTQDDIGVDRLPDEGDTVWIEGYKFKVDTMSGNYMLGRQACSGVIREQRLSDFAGHAFGYKPKQSIGSPETDGRDKHALKRYIMDIYRHNALYAKGQREESFVKMYYGLASKQFPGDAFKGLSPAKSDACADALSEMLRKSPVLRDPDTIHPDFNKFAEQYRSNPAYQAWANLTVQLPATAQFIHVDVGLGGTTGVEQKVKREVFLPDWESSIKPVEGLSVKSRRRRR